MKKREYVKPVTEIIEIEPADIIVTSGGKGNNGNHWGQGHGSGKPDKN